MSSYSAYRLLPGLSAGLVLSLLGACNDPPQTKTSPPLAASRTADAAQLARGAQLFRQHCASCHGERAQGAVAWQRPGPDGKYPPPPLDGSAHAWHHPHAWLKRTIRNGTVPQGGNMPAWGAILSDADIDAVITWFQSLWPEEIYREWERNDQRTRK